MSEFDLLIRGEIEPLLPLPRLAAPSWDDVLSRARGRRRPRWVSLGAAAAALATAAIVAATTPVGPALAGVLDDFSAWLTGNPGTPATQSEQEAFEQANARTWLGFAPGTKLRRLVTTTRSGTEFTLFGFRSGDDLCLKLVATGAASGNATHCAPEHDLQTALQPAIVVASDEGLGGRAGPAGPDGYTPVAYQATFGIASDGVSRVTVGADDGTSDAVVGGNAFLYVADHPKAGTRVRSVKAVAGNGDQLALDFQSAPFGNFDLPAAPKGTFHGPAAVQRTVAGGTIGWLVRGEQRGEAVPADFAARLAPSIERLTDMHRAMGFKNAWPPQPVHVILERAIRPDSNDVVRMIVIGVSSGNSMGDANAGVCIDVAERDAVSGGCSPLAKLFGRSPLSIGMGGNGSSQYSLVSGAASDDVARITAYLGSGDVVPVALRDNVFLVRVARGAFPLRIVAYDADGKVISVNDFASDGMTSPAPPEARKSIRTIKRLVGEHGGTATLRAGTPAGGYRCWNVDFMNGAGQGGCTPWPDREPPLLLLNAQTSGGDMFLLGQVPEHVAKVTVRFADGTSVSIDTSIGFALAELPSAELSGQATFVELRAYDRNGNEIAKRGLKVRHQTIR
jgi:hypothetical protein